MFLFVESRALNYQEEDLYEMDERSNGNRYFYPQLPLPSISITTRKYVYMYTGAISHNTYNNILCLRLIMI